MAVSDYYTTASLNVTISGINIAEGCPPGNINGAIRQLMADVRVMYNALPDISTLMPKAGGVFAAPPTLAGAGKFRSNADAALASGLHYFLPEGSALPSSPVEGMTVDFYTP